MTNRLTLWLAYALIAAILILLFLAVINMRSGGSLDDLPGDIIKRVVGGPEE